MVERTELTGHVLKSQQEQLGLHFTSSSQRPRGAIALTHPSVTRAADTQWPWQEINPAGPLSALLPCGHESPPPALPMS